MNRIGFGILCILLGLAVFCWAWWAYVGRGITYSDIKALETVGPVVDAINELKWEGIGLLIIAYGLRLLR